MSNYINTLPSYIFHKSTSKTSKKIYVNGRPLREHLSLSKQNAYVPGCKGSGHILMPGDERKIFIGLEKDGDKFLVIYSTSSPIFEFINYELTHYDQIYLKGKGRQEIIPWLESFGFSITNIQWCTGVYSSI